MNAQLFKKNSGLTIVGSLISTLALLTSLPSHSESLKEIYQQALENDHEYRAAKAELGAGLESKNLGRADLLPIISGRKQWSQSTLENSLYVEPNPLPSTPDLVNTPEQDFDSSEYSINLSQSIIHLGNWHNFKKGKLQAEGAQLEFEVAEQNLILRTAEAYLGALKSADQVETAEAELNALSHQLEQTKQRFEVGLTAITEVHEAQAAYDSSTASKLLADGSLGIAFETLEALTGQSYDSLYPLKKNFSATPPQPAVRDEWVNLALSNNTRLKIAENLAKAAKETTKAAKSAYLPTLSGSLSYSGSGSKTNDITTVDNNGTSIGLELKVPLYTGGRTTATRRRAANEQLRSEELHLKAKRDAILDARTSYLTVLTSAATVKARAQAIISNRSALEATKAGYDVGTRDLVDVLDSQRFLYRAERDYSDALYEYILATLKLKQASGILAPEDLFALDGSLDSKRLVKYKR